MRTSRKSPPLDLGGRLRFGPDTEYVDAIDYKVDAGKRDIFYESAKKNIKGLDKEALNPDMAGIRPNPSFRIKKINPLITAC